MADVQRRPIEKQAKTGSCVAMRDEFLILLSLRELFTGGRGHFSLMDRNAYAPPG